MERTMQTMQGSRYWLKVGTSAVNQRRSRTQGAKESHAQGHIHRWMPLELKTLVIKRKSMCHGKGTTTALNYSSSPQTHVAEQPLTSAS